jgi:peptidoglycan/LPS O-acetylase OafA/YrhL
LGFIANLFMLQAWGVPGAGQWNFPAWTLSAEFFAYLIFPLIVGCAAAMARRPFLLLGLSLGLVALIEAAWAYAGHGRLGEMTQFFGIVRGACGVIVGVAARYAFEKVAWTPLQAAGACLVGAAAAGFAAIESAPLWTLHAGAVLLVLGLASLDRAGQATPLSGRLMQRLGEMSYALFILHVPLFIMATQALSLAGWDGRLDLVSGAAILAVAVGAAAVANRLLEDPAREIIRSWKLFPAPKTP